MKIIQCDRCGQTVNNEVGHADVHVEVFSPTMQEASQKKSIDLCFACFTNFVHFLGRPTYDE